MRILAVDDDPVILGLLPILFRQAGYPKISVASGGHAALEILRDPNRGFDCFILDIEMPQMDGIELCQRIRSIPAYRNTPIIMLTAKTDKVSVERAFIAGANDYIAKPFDVKEISSRVQIAMRMLEQVDEVHMLDNLDTTTIASLGRHPFAIADPVRIKGVDQLILPFSFGNYLVQLSRSRLKRSSVVAVKIDNIQNIYDTYSTQEFAIALTEVADAITEVFASPQLLLSYYGSGVLLFITTATDLPSWTMVEGATQGIINNSGAVRTDGSAMNIKLSIGRPLRPNNSRTQRVRLTIDRAISFVEIRARAKLAERSYLLYRTI